MYVVEPSPRVGAPLSGLRNRALAGFRSNQRNRAACSNRITRPMRVVGMLGTSAAQRSTALGACRPAPEASGTRAAPVGSRSRQAARGRYYRSPLGAIGLPIESDARAVPGSPRRANPRSYTGWRPRPRSAWHARPAQEHPLEHRPPHRLALRVTVPDTFLQAVDEVVGHELRASVGRDEGLDVDLAVSAGLGRADFPLELPERVDVPLALPDRPAAAVAPMRLPGRPLGLVPDFAGLEIELTHFSPRGAPGAGPRPRSGRSWGRPASAAWARPAHSAVWR